MAYYMRTMVTTSEHITPHIDEIFLIFNEVWFIFFPCTKLLNAYANTYIVWACSLLSFSSKNSVIIICFNAISQKKEDTA